MAKFLKVVAGQVQEEATVTISAGAGDSGKAVSLDASGKVDISVLPTGIGADTTSVLTSEILAAGDKVNLYDNAGTRNARKADNSNGREADGFVIVGFASGATATVYLEGANNALSALTAGTKYYLGTSGAVTATAPSAAGARVQFLGKATSATALDFQRFDSILLV